MKNVLKRSVAAALALNLMLSGTTSVFAAPLNISQDDLENLKKILQEEIDRYEEDRYEYEYEMSSSASGNSILDGLFGLSLTSESKAATYDTGMAEYEELEAYAEEDMCYEMCEPSVYDSGYGFNTEEYAAVKEKGFVKVATDPLSTFAADVDTGSFCNLRRMIRDGYSLDEIPSGAIRTEELLNYFDYKITDENISDGKFSLQYELTTCPWAPEHDLLMMTVQANETDLPSVGNNFTFLLDTSGSMDYAEKIALAKCSMKLLSYTLTEEDRVSIVTYSGDSYVALDSCPGNDYELICETLDTIYPYGGTNGSGGINAAYDLAEKNFVEGGNNRVFIFSDGDMNLGITSNAGLVDLIREKKESGIFLSVLGFGSGNYSDENMESIADAGNGNYFYIDCLDEAQHVLIEKQKETTVTVAKDVKFQAEFNPALVSEYRLIGYENRDVADDDFKNDAVDGGEVGAGQQVTLLYELVRTSDSDESASGLKYQGNRELTSAADSDELLTVSINYKEPDKDTSVTESYAVSASSSEENVSADMSLAISVAELSMLLHNSSFAGSASLEEALNYAKEAQSDANIYRMGYQLMLEMLN